MNTPKVGRSKAAKMVRLLKMHGFAEHSTPCVGRHFQKNGHIVHLQSDGAFHCQFASGRFGECNSYVHSYESLEKVLTELAEGKRN